MQEEKSLSNKVFVSIAAMIIGLILIIWQRSAGETIIRIIGYVMIATGVVYLIMFFTKRRENENLIYAIGAAGAGLLLVLLAHLIVDAFPIIMGIVMILNAITAFSLSMKSGDTPWYMYIFFAALIVLGVLILLHPSFVANLMYLFIGISCLLSGVTGLMVALHE